MQIYAYNSSGFGNAVFAYLSAILFTILFDAEIINIQSIDDIAYYQTNYKNIDDAEFIRIVEAKINENKTLIDCSQNYFLPGFYQHDNYYIRYKKEILEKVKQTNNIQRKYRDSQYYSHLHVNDEKQQQYNRHVRFNRFVR
jgi:hypothetical protein